MPLEYIPTKAGLPNPAVNDVLTQLRANAPALKLDDAVLYYGWPKYTDYDSVRHYVDIALLSPRLGLLLVRVLQTESKTKLEETVESLAQASATALSQLIRSPLLRDKSRQLKVAVVPLVVAPGSEAADYEDVEIAGTADKLLSVVDRLQSQRLSKKEFQEARSIIEGAKALARPTRRTIQDPHNQRLAVALNALEEEIASFDQRQRQVALMAVGCPQRIRGLAGSGKTIILAMKAALAHLDDPSKDILVTFYTRSLRDHLTKLITRFHRHFGEGDPDWNKVHVRHGWGSQSLPGVYRDACLRASLAPLTYSMAAAGAKPKQAPFDYACRTLIGKTRVDPFYDLVLIDEGQDFPSGFYELCFYLTTGDRDSKSLVWAYDELQNIFDVKVRTPEQLYGKDEDGEPRISLERSLPPQVDTNDFVLPKCYRNQRDVLVLAHAIGFGIYGQPVQMLQDKEHWEDVGYEVSAQNMNPGSDVIIRRPDRNSPTQLDSPQNVGLVEVTSFDSFDDEVDYCVGEVRKFLKGGLQPEDVMIIAIDDRSARAYLESISIELAQHDIASNNIIADRYSEPSFQIEGRCTLTTVYRAKGNEAALVFVLGCDAVPLASRSGRNRLFTAFTRTKGWLRISGMGKNFGALRSEIETALELAPEMKFKMPDPKEIELIQRDLSEKAAKKQRVRAELDRLKDEFGLSEQDLQQLVAKRGASQKGRNG